MNKTKKRSTLGWVLEFAGRKKANYIISVILPMGYFNNNSLGHITSVTTNTMEALSDVATRVVMLTTQGILTTIVITAFVFVFDLRIGLLLTAGVAICAFSVYFYISGSMSLLYCIMTDSCRRTAFTAPLSRTENGL